MEKIMKLMALFRERDPEIITDPSGKVIAIRLTIPVTDLEDSEYADTGS